MLRPPALYRQTILRPARSKPARVWRAQTVLSILRSPTLMAVKMSLDHVTELLQRATEAERRQSNFIMAASGASIAYALNQLGDAALSWDKSALLAALFLWGVSFFAGCAHVSYSTSFEKMKAEDIAASQTGKGPVSPYLKRIFDGTEGVASGRWHGRMYQIQHLALFLGVVLYMVWRIFFAH